MVDIVTNGQYRNISLAHKYKKTNGKLVLENGKKIIEQRGIDDGESIIVEKIFADGKEITTQYGISYLIRALYEGEEVSFFLKERHYKVFEKVGGIGDKVKITGEKKLITNPKTGVEMVFIDFDFELVQ
jgi:hypothetical protein